MRNSVPVRVEEIFIDTQEVSLALEFQLILCVDSIYQVDVAEPGDNVRMKVKGIEEEDLRYGFVMCPKESIVQGCRFFDAKVNILEYKSIICPGYISVMHIHAATEEVAIMHLLATLDKKGQILEKKPKFVKQGQVSYFPPISMSQSAPFAAFLSARACAPLQSAF
jgi:translation elongation factor EF-1alpha